MLRSIRSRLLALVVAAVVPFIILIGAGLWSQWRSDQAAAVQETIDEARVLAAQVDDHLGNLENLLIGVGRAVSLNPSDKAANDALLQKVKAEEPDFVGQIELLGPDGSVIGSSFPPERMRPNQSGKRYFEEVMGGKRLSVGELVHGRTSQRWNVVVARPVEDRAGAVGGVLAVGSWLDRLQDALRIQGLPAGAIVTIINQDGIIIARTADAEQWIGRDVSKLGRTRVHLSQREGSEIAPWATDGVARVTAYSMAHRAPWQVVVGLPTNTAFATVAARLGWSSLFILSALIIGFAIAWVYSGHVVRPLHQLGTDAARLASGDLSHRSEVNTRDEIGALADDFNRMATALDRRAQEANCAADDVRQAKDTLAAVIDASPVAIACCDLERNTVLWNRSAEDMFGYSAEEVIGRPTNLRRTPCDDPQSLSERAMKGETFRNVETTRVRKDGSLIHLRIAAAPMYNLDGRVRGVVRTYLDVTESKRAEEQLRRLAHYDPLTGLPNRLSLQKELGRLLAGNGHSPVAIALFDLDGFKDVNDTLGHSTGDQLLIEVCQRFVEIADGLGRPAKVCRLGGDEFVVIVPDCGDPRVIAEVVDAILMRLAEPFDINGNILHVGSSAGIAIAPNDAAQADDLIANADLALYQAKSEGGKVYRFFLPALRARAQARRGLGIELRRAFAEGELELHYQPQIRLADNAVLGAEALLRWRHPQRGLIAPAAFIDALAESSIAAEVGTWIIRCACEQAARWRGLGLHLDRIAVNLFPAQVQSLALVADVEAGLHAGGLPPDCLELEITENAALIGEAPDMTLHKIDALGVKLAFDDFGTGYASLTYLTRFPVWRIKIDRGFVARITDSLEDAAMVRSLIAMAHNLGLAVIAEGVETEAQAAFLLKEHCEEAQGFLYAKPLTATEFETYLRARPTPANLSTADGAAEARRAERARAQKTVSRRKLRRI